MDEITAKKVLICLWEDGLVCICFLATIAAVIFSVKSNQNYSNCKKAWISNISEQKSTHELFHALQRSN